MSQVKVLTRRNTKVFKKLLIENGIRDELSFERHPDTFSAQSGVGRLINPFSRAVKAFRRNHPSVQLKFIEELTISAKARQKDNELLENS